MINYYCENTELMKELVDKEDLYHQISNKLTLCPYCRKGYFEPDDEGSDYPTQHFYTCSNCLATASKRREGLIDDIINYNAYEYWNYAIYVYIREFEYGTDYTDNEVKKRDFNPSEFVKEGHLDWHGNPITSWEDFVEGEIREHLKDVDAIIAKAMKVPMLKKIFVKVTKEK